LKEVSGMIVEHIYKFIVKINWIVVAFTFISSALESGESFQGSKQPEHMSIRTMKAEIFIQIHLCLFHR